jgi:transposase
MSTDLLYHGFGIHGYEHVDSSFSFEGGEVTLVIRHKRASHRCSVRGCGNVVLHGQQSRRLRTVPLGGKPVWARVAIPRVECRRCAAEATAERVFDDWLRRAEASGIEMPRKFAYTLALGKSASLAYYDYRISTGPLEGTNNKIRAMRRQAYGFRDQEFFILMILALHETKNGLVG